MKRVWSLVCGALGDKESRVYLPDMLAILVTAFFAVSAGTIFVIPHRYTDDAFLTAVSPLWFATALVCGGEKEANVQSALNVALEAFSDGLYRFFINAQEITALDAPLNLQDGDTVAIIRLTMLTGGIF